MQKSNDRNIGLRGTTARLRVALAVMTIVAAGALATPAAPADELPSMVVEWSTVTRERSFDGIVEAERRSTVSSQVAARIEELPFDVDDFVERGDIIVRIGGEDVRTWIATAGEDDAKGSK